MARDSPGSFPVTAPDSDVVPSRPQSNPNSINVACEAIRMRVATLQTSRIPILRAARAITPPVLWEALYRSLVVRSIPDANCYRPHFSPWLAPDFMSLYESIRPFTSCTSASCWTLHNMLQQALHVPGDVAEAGVFKGGTALLLRKGIEGHGRALRLFDSFEGMAHTSAQLDRHRQGDFSDTSVEGVTAVVGNDPFIDYRKGWIPETFTGLEPTRYCFAHIDLDLHQSIIDSLQFIYPRMSQGGVIVLDDYGFASCPGARLAVDAYFEDKPERPLALQTGQAIAIKL
jgi:O-methyltransferase